MSLLTTSRETKQKNALCAQMTIVYTAPQQLIIEPFAIPEKGERQEY